MNVNCFRTIDQNQIAAKLGLSSHQSEYSTSEDEAQGYNKLGRLNETYTLTGTKADGRTGRYLVHLRPHCLSRLPSAGTMIGAVPVLGPGFQGAFAAGILACASRGKRATGAFTKCSEEHHSRAQAETYRIEDNYDDARMRPSDRLEYAKAGGSQLVQAGLALGVTGLELSLWHVHDPDHHETVAQGAENLWAWLAEIVQPLGDALGPILQSGSELIGLPSIPQLGHHLTGGAGLLFLLDLAIRTLAAYCRHDLCNPPRVEVVELDEQPTKYEPTAKLVEQSAEMPKALSMRRIA